MVEVDTTFPDLVHSIENPWLLIAIKAHLLGMSDDTCEGLYTALCHSALLVVTESQPEQPTRGAFMVDEQGIGKYERGTKIPLQTLTHTSGVELLPVFTDVRALSKFEKFEDPYCLLLSGFQVLEMLATGSADYLSINPGSYDNIELPRSSIEVLVGNLRLSGLIPKEDRLEMLGYELR
ncbi:hypothetical protein BVY02_00035 [bacterium J17]|nr:hypothetical protein BVY02_00035 [bacterium J17]